MTEQIPNEDGIMAQVTSVFDPSIYEFEVSYTHHPVRAICNIKINVKHDKSQCLEIKIDIGKKKIIKINTLAKCGNYTGSELLKKVDDLAKLLHVTKIELTDASLRNYCGAIIHLPILSILTTGSSWYNSQGYVSDNHDDIMRHNALIVNDLFVKMMDDAQKVVGDNSALMAKLNEVVGAPNDDSVKTYVDKLVASIGRGENCSKANASLLKDLVDYTASASILKFDQTLYREVSGGRRRRMQTKRNKKNNKKFNNKSNKIKRNNKRKS
jgi:hypothetical protein